jgi:pimeloyl-ACP methyl ester carboxylesterase
MIAKLEDGVMARTITLVPYRRPAGVHAAVVILPGGAARSRGQYWSVVDVRLRTLARRLAGAGGADGLAVYLLRYRYRGWNGERADTLVDTYEALDRIRRAHGEVPVALVGNSLGGRAAFQAAGTSAVRSVAGIAPWLPPTDPVDQLSGRKVLIVHGAKDRSSASAAMSLAYARRARVIVPDLARFEVAGAGHLLLLRERDCWALVAAFVTATVGSRPLDPAIADAMAADGLRTPLEMGFGRV